MNNKFYFALAMTAGLLASCSSDDYVTQAPGGNFAQDGSEQTPIQISVNDISGYTRGTGSVVGTTWGGQTFNLFMFDRGTFTPSQYNSADEGEEEVMTDIYNNAVMTTTPGSSIAQQVIDADNHVQYQYFPSQGRFAFWAYRADDAALKDETTGDPIVKFTNADGTDAASPEEATQVRIPFAINGTQDLMIAETNTEAAKEALMAKEKSLTEEEAEDYIYSAYAARRLVNPTMKFHHQLSRLQFKVKAANRQASEMADIQAEGENYIRGVKVTKVEVWSKSTGSLIAAYKGDAPASRITWDEGQEWVSLPENQEERNQFNLDGITTLTPFELKSRESKQDKADILFYEVGKGLTEAPAALLSQVPEGYSLESETFGNDAPCYISGEKNQDGTAKNASITFGEARADGSIATVWVMAKKNGNHGDEKETPWTEAIQKENVTANLVDLVPVIPKWDGYNAEAGWTAYTPVATTYTWEDITATATDAEKTDATEEKAEPTPSTPGTLNKIVKTEVAFVEKYWKLTAIVYDTDNITDEYAGEKDAEGVPTGEGSSDGVIVKVTDGTTGKANYYKYHAAGGEVNDGHAVATPIGESMMVAPADENGYIVRFTYVRSVLKTSGENDFVNREGQAVINVKVKETANAGTEWAGKFMPGKYYTVTAVFWPDGQIKYENGDIEAEENGDEDLAGTKDEDGDVTFNTEN